MVLYPFEERKLRVSQDAFVAESALVIGDAQNGKNTVLVMRATISDYSIVGECTIIGEMGLVKSHQKVPDGVVAFGIPVKIAHRHNIPGAFMRID